MSAKRGLCDVARIGSIMMPQRESAGKDKKSPRKNNRELRLFFIGCHKSLGLFLLEELLVLAVELIDATGAIDEFHLTRIEGV